MTPATRLERDDGRPRVTPADCSFCAIAAAGDPDVLIHATAEVVAFLDHRPVFHGHTLVVPRRHIDTLDQLPPALFAPLLAEVQLVMRAQSRALASDGAFVANNNVVSQTEPHLHVHVVPRRFKDGLRGFFWPRVKYDSDAHRNHVRAALAKAIAQEIGD